MQSLDNYINANIVKTLKYIECEGLALINLLGYRFIMTLSTLINLKHTEFAHWNSEALSCMPN